MVKKDYKKSVENNFNFGNFFGYVRMKRIINFSILLVLFILVINLMGVMNHNNNLESIKTRNMHSVTNKCLNVCKFNIEDDGLQNVCFQNCLTYNYEMTYNYEEYVRIC